MERESFENDDVAAVMNQYFVCIKVDREERPDIDHVYMTAVQGDGASGGWPMTMILTPEGSRLSAALFPAQTRKSKSHPARPRRRGPGRKSRACFRSCR